MRKIAIFASGNGSNFEAIVEAYRNGELLGEPMVCVCDKPGAYVIERARRLSIPVIVVSPRDFNSKTEYEREVAEQLYRLGIDLICLAGYMRIVGPVLLGSFKDRIINIHPSLLPAFKGAHAIRDAFDYGVRVYGVTVHYVNEDLDGGRIIDQEAFHADTEDIATIEERIHKIEHSLFPRCINKVISSIK